MKIAKSVSLVCLIAVALGVADSASAVNMTPQIRRLVNEKREKMAALEKCEGKKKGFMIAGLSTIGLTAVGVAGNVILANKSSNLSDTLDEKNSELSKQQEKLSGLNAQIADKERAEKEAAEAKKRAEEEARKREECKKKDMDYDERTGQCKDKPVVLPKVGSGCDGGKWVADDNGNQDCSDTDGNTVKCKCEQTEESKQKKEPQKDQKQDQSKKKQTQKKNTKPADKKTNECIKGYRDKLDGTPNCQCDQVRGLIPVPNEAGASVCLCPKGKLWNEQQNKCVLSSLPDVNTDGVGFGYYDIDGSDKRDSGCSVSNPGDWCVEFPDDKVVSGIAVCNDTYGTYAEASNDEQTETGGQNCWCKMTHPAESRWVFYGSNDDSAHCALSCAYYVQDDVAGFRGAVFGSVAQ